MELPRFHCPAAVLVREVISVPVPLSVSWGLKVLSPVEVPVSVNVLAATVPWAIAPVLLHTMALALETVLESTAPVPEMVKSRSVEAEFEPKFKLPTRLLP